MRKGLISILMPAYNSEKFIDAGINSLINQTYKNWELLICNDFSTDNTGIKIKEYSNFDNRIKPFENAQNLGYLKTWNKLLDLADGEYITFLDADDTCSSDRLIILKEFLDNNSEIGIVGSGINIISEIGDKISEKNYPSDSQNICAALLTEKFPFCGSAVMIRNEVKLSVGFYNLFYNRLGWEDHDWIIRVCDKFIPANVPQTLYNYRDNIQSVTRVFSPDNIQKIFIRKIGISIHQIRKEKGLDLFDSENFWELYKLVNSFTRPFENNKNLFFRFLMLREKNISRRFFYLQKALRFNFLDIRTIYYFFFR